MIEEYLPELHVKPGHEMYLNHNKITINITFIYVKPGHEMYLNIRRTYELDICPPSLNQDMRCI